MNGEADGAQFRRPASVDDSGRFTHTWPLADGPGRGLGPLLRWQVDRLRSGRPDAEPAEFRRCRPALALPRSASGELRITWVGQSTFLVQLDGLNILTDPVWSRRASPVQWAGPARITEPGVPFDLLPPIDVVLLSHDHYDHLDLPTVRRLHRRFPGVTWIAPLGFGAWLVDAGIDRVTELDWWQNASIAVRTSRFDVTGLPAQHWGKRSPFDERQRLWASWSFSVDGGERLYFCGDSGYFGGFREIGHAFAPFAACLLPIGAYEPRWFMHPAHMNPEEAVRTWLDLGGAGMFVGMHWGTFRLTDEPPLEPPRRTRAAWAEAGLPAAALWLPVHGETRVLRDPVPEP